MNNDAVELNGEMDGMISSFFTSSMCNRNRIPIVWRYYCGVMESGI